MRSAATSKRIQKLWSLKILLSIRSYVIHVAYNLKLREFESFLGSSKIIYVKTFFPRNKANDYFVKRFFTRG